MRGLIIFLILSLLQSTSVYAATVSVQFTGFGGGVVNSDPAGVACSSTCTGTFSTGTGVTLMPTPDSNSWFAGWTGGVCSGTGDCTVTVNGDTAVTAIFAQAPFIRTLSPAEQYFSSISDAYNSQKAGGSVVIESRSAVLYENLNFSSDTDVMLTGGYNSQFSGNDGYTTLNGSLTVGRGRLAVSNLILAPNGTPPPPGADPSAALGPELLADPGIEGPYTGGLDDNWQYEGAVQTAISTAPHTGTYAQQVQLSVLNGTPGNASANLRTSAAVMPGRWYRTSFWARRIAGTTGDVFPWIYAPGGGFSYLSRPITSAAYAQFVCTAQATATSMLLGVNNYPSTVPSDTVVIDDASIREIPFSALVSLQDWGSQYGKAISNLTFQPGTQAGLVFCADSAVNPQNYLLAYHDGTHIAFYKVIGGAYTSLPTGGDIPYYNVSTNPDVAYVPGATLEIQRVPGTNVFSVYYNGRHVGQQTVTDAVIANNTVHGAFNTFEGNKVTFSHSPARTIQHAVFLGGSITNAAGTTQSKYGWQWLLRDYLDTGYPAISFIHTNAAAGGTDSWYSLVRLQTDVLAFAPDIIFVDEAVNDGELAPTNPAWPYVGEAIIRRIRAALPHGKIVICNFMRPTGSDASPDPNTETLRAAWNKIAGYYNCDLYRMDTALLGVLPANPTKAQVDTYFSSSGNVHPNNAGHGLIYSGLKSSINPLAVNQWTGNLGDYPRLNPNTGDYEAASTILTGDNLLSNHQTSGTWTPTGAGGIASSVAGSAVTYTGPMIMVGLDVALQGGSWPTGLQYSLDGGPWVGVLPQNPSVWQSEFMFLTGPRAAHTLSIRVNTGSATINRLLIL